MFFIILFRLIKIIYSTSLHTNKNVKCIKGNMLIKTVHSGTNDRILLITGPAESVRYAHQVTWEKIYGRPDMNKPGTSEELKVVSGFGISMLHVILIMNVLC